MKSSAVSSSRASTGSSKERLRARAEEASPHVRIQRGMLPGRRGLRRRSAGSDVARRRSPSVRRQYGSRRDRTRAKPPPLRGRAVQSFGSIHRVAVSKPGCRPSSPSRARRDERERRAASRTPPMLKRCSGCQTVPEWASSHRL
jgi:hypothetical protein